MPRFSVDIDLTYLHIADWDTVDNETTAMMLRLRKRLLNAGINATIMPSEDAARGITAEKDGIGIKIETNFVLTGNLFPTDRRELCDTAQSVLEMYVEINVLALPELYGGKICAAVVRQHPRDLFDTKLLLENEGIDDQTRKSFIVNVISQVRPMSNLLDPDFINIEVDYTSAFKGMALEYVTLDDLLTARKNLLRTLRKGMTAEERSFLLSLQNRTPEWSLLGLSGAHDLPAVKARLQRIQAMKEKGHREETEKLVDCLKLWGC